MLKKFLKLKKERVSDWKLGLDEEEEEDVGGSAETLQARKDEESEGAEHEDEEEAKDKDDGDDDDSPTPWNTLKSNVDVLSGRGFDKEAILQCLIVLARPRAELTTLSDLHVKEPPEKIREMDIEDQKALLNLIVYHGEKCGVGKTAEPEVDPLTPPPLTPPSLTPPRVACDACGTVILEESLDRHIREHCPGGEASPRRGRHAIQNNMTGVVGGSGSGSGSGSGGSGDSDAKS